ncbi:MAG: RNA-binding protein [Oscillospiraceae bacterium]|nr:RNA-binding protein [Oscillospiraceae bacterium]
MDKTLKEREYFISGIRNLFTLCEKRGTPCFSAFLAEEQRAEIEPMAEKLARSGFQILFWGGYPDAQRTMLGVFPDYITPETELFPIVAYTARFGGDFREIGHRDVLGTLMGQQIRRETIGDISIQPGKAVIFAEERVEKVLATQIDRIGGTGITMEKGFEPFSSEQRFAEIRGTLSSLRLDAAAALCAGTAREKASAMIAAGLCSLNHLEEKDQSKRLAEGDILTIRGKGKFRLAEVGGLTKKGRTTVTFLKYL